MGWLDIVGIGIDAAQFYQLSKMRGTMQDAESSRLSETERAGLIETYRNVVFGSLKSAEMLADHVEDSPQPVFVVTNLLRRRLNLLGISPETFPEFADKEYVQKAFARMDEVLQAASGHLASGKKDEAQDCVQAMQEMSLLDQAIAAESSSDELERLRGELGEVSKEKNRSTLFAMISLLGGPILACMGCGGLYVIYGGSSRGSFGGTVFQFGELLMLVIAVGGLALGAILLSGKNQSKYSELKRAIKTLDDQLPDKDTLATIHEKFGGQSEKELNQIKQEREDLIRRVMGQIENYDKFLLTSEG